MNINEIYISLSGEPDGFNNQGGLTTFVRLQGCNLACSWCDTTRAMDTDLKCVDMTVDEVVRQCTTKHVVITGGEPLQQMNEVKLLVDRLTSVNRSREARQFVTIETNGSIDITIDPARTKYQFLRFVVDYKLDSSGMNQAMSPVIFQHLYSLDVIKFVLKDLQDYRQAREVIFKYPEWRAKKVFSPIVGGVWATRLAERMLEDQLEGVTLSLQLHKQLGLR